MIKHIILPLTVLVATAACATGGGEEASHAGRYDLLGTADATLPVELAERDGCRFVLTGGVLDSRADGTYTSRILVRRDCTGSERADSLMDLGTTGKYELLEGDTVRYTDDAGGFAGYGSRAGDTLRILGPVQTLVFMRN